MAGKGAREAQRMPFIEENKLIPGTTIYFVNILKPARLPENRR